MGAPDKRQVPPRRFTVPSGGFPLPVRISNRYVLFSRSTTGSTQASFLFFFDNQKDRTRGTWAPPHAGLGLGTVRAQIQAITVASPPPYSFGSFTLG